MLTFNTQRGETKRWLLWTPPGTDITGWMCTANARQYDARKRRVEPGSPVAAELTISAFAGDYDGRGPGFYATLSPGDCENLALGHYQIDARVVQPSGDVTITDAWLIYVIEPATEAA